jgi:hypothetical protein
MEERNDQILSEIAAASGNIENFLDNIFGFLHRKTDFYVEFSEDEATKPAMGFRKGIAKKMLINSFEKYPMKPYQHLASSAQPISSNRRFNAESHMKAPNIQISEDGKQIPIGNGGVAKNYFWTQSLMEVNIYVDVPLGTKSKDIICVIRPGSIDLKIKENPIMQGHFEESVKASESFWTLASENSSFGPQILITLEKCRENWWKHVLLGDPEIDTTKVCQLFEFSGIELILCLRRLIQPKISPNMIPLLNQPSES